MLAIYACYCLVSADDGSLIRIKNPQSILCFYVSTEGSLDVIRQEWSFQTNHLRTNVIIFIELFFFCSSIV